MSALTLEQERAASWQRTVAKHATRIAGEVIWGVPVGARDDMQSIALQESVRTIEKHAAEWPSKCPAEREAYARKCARHAVVRAMAAWQRDPANVATVSLNGAGEIEAEQDNGSLRRMTTPRNLWIDDPEERLLDALVTHTAGSDLRNRLPALLDTLTPQQDTAVRLHYGIDCAPLSHRKAAEEMGISRQRVSQLIDAALCSLRKAAALEDAAANTVAGEGLCST